MFILKMPPSDNGGFDYAVILIEERMILDTIKEVREIVYAADTYDECAAWLAKREPPKPQKGRMGEGQYR